MFDEIETISEKTYFDTPEYEEFVTTLSIDDNVAIRLEDGKHLIGIVIRKTSSRGYPINTIAKTVEIETSSLTHSGTRTWTCTASYADDYSRKRLGFVCGGEHRVVPVTAEIREEVEGRSKLREMVIELNGVDWSQFPKEDLDFFLGQLDKRTKKLKEVQVG